MAIAVATFTTGGFTNASVTVNKPSGTVDGDLLVAYVMRAGNGVDGISTPSGWTKYLTTELPFGAEILSAYWKIASSEGASWTWDASGSFPTFGDLAGFVFRVTGHEASPYDTSSGAELSGTGNSRTHACPITPTAANSLLFFTAGSVSAGAHNTRSIATSDPGWTEADEIVSGNYRLSVAYGVRPETTSTGNATLGVASSSGSTRSSVQLSSFNPGVELGVSSGNPIFLGGGF